jgi:DNA-binding LacI/PurR family transcriptional regulator
MNQSKPAGKGMRKRAVPQSSNQPVTSFEVAKAAGVSRATVSRAFTPHASISRAMRERVMAAANELGYRPNALARSLITRTSNVVGLIMADWENPFYTALLRGFSERLQARNYELMLLTSPEQLGIDTAVRRLQQYQVAGIIFVSANPSFQVANECQRAGVRTVILNRDPGDLPIPGVVCDQVTIGTQLARGVLDAGYTRIALLRGNPEVSSGIQRTDAIKQALAADDRVKIVADRVNVMGYAAGRAAIQELMAQKNKPDVVICSSDLTAIGVLDSARIDLGLSVPDELGVFGFGDSPTARLASYDLSTVRLPIDQMIDAAVATVLAPAPTDTARAELNPFSAQLVLRSTLRKPRK